MITFPKLGKIGRLGNHLFQIASTIATALDRRDCFGFPRWAHEADFLLTGCFHDQLPEGPLYKEPRFAYDEIPSAPGLSLEGFFQSERYFARHADRVRTLLTPRRPSVRGPLLATASLHVRRGDYLLLQEKHPILPMSYYSAAMNLLRDRGVNRFLIFSDDLPWCRTQQWPDDVVVMPDLSPMEQFRLTIDCSDHILANSTFSWWSAWLNYNPDKMVVAPKAWFGDSYQKDFPTADLFPPGWIIL